MSSAPPEGWAADGIAWATALLGGGSWEATTLHGTGGALYGSNVTRLRSPDDSVVVKVIRRNDAAPHDPASWRRELDLYRSDWLLRALPDGVTVPDRRASTTTDAAAVIVMEDVPFDDRTLRSTDWYGRLSRRLAELASVPVDDVPSWASRGFVESETSKLLAALPQVTTTPSPPVADLLASWRDEFRRLPDAVPPLLSWLGDLPQGFNHLDAFSRNATEVDGRFVLVDWAYAGLAPIGTDAAGIIAMTCMHGDTGGFRLDDLHRSVVEGFASGVATKRAPDRSVLERAIDVLLTLRWMAFLAQLHALRDSIVDVAESVGGRPFDEVHAGWRALSDLVRPIASETLHRFER